MGIETMGIFAKIVGGTTGAIAAYDTHKIAHASTKTTPYLNNDRAITELQLCNLKDSGDSYFGNLVQKSYIKKRSLTNIFINIDRVTSYFQGLVKGVWKSVLPLTMAAAAVFGGKLTSKVGTAGLLFYGLNYAISHVFRLGPSRFRDT